MKLKKYSEFSENQKIWAMKGFAICSKVKGTDKLKDWLFDVNGWPQKRIDKKEVK